MGKLGARLFHLFHRRSIRTEIAVSMAITSILVMSILGISIAHSSGEIIQKNYQANHQLSMELTDEMVSVQLGAVVDQVRDLLADEDLAEILLEDSGRTPYFSASAQNRLQSILTAVLNLSIVQEIVVVSESGSLYYASKYANASALFSHYYTDGSFLEESWTSLADAALGKEIFFGYNIILKDETLNSFSMVKKLIEPFSGEAMGYLVLNFRKTVISNIFNGKNLTYESSSFMVLDTETEKYPDQDYEYVVYYKGDEEYREAILEDYWNGEEGEFLFTGYHNDLTGWDIIGIVKKSELQKESNYINRITMTAGVILAGLQIVVASVIAKRINRPLAELEAAMREVEEGNRNVTARFDETEIGRIGNQFKHLVNDNLELEDRARRMELMEKESQLLLLQAQINPHFLYNTLDNIYMMAVIKEEDEIADMIGTLSELFRLNLNEGKKQILVEDELHHIEIYMKIQSNRFRGKYTLRMNVEEGLREKQILVFILQPLVENAVLHGLEPKLESGEIRITGRQKDSMMVFEVEDDGVGIPDMEVLERGYGIHNIRERLLLFYGEGNYELRFSSHVGQGTSVLLRLPVLTEDREDLNVQNSSD